MHGLHISRKWVGTIANSLLPALQCCFVFGRLFHWPEVLAQMTLPAKLMIAQPVIPPAV
jgi:hypothetical protein